MFVDSVKISVKAGKGGDGVVSFRREKYVERGGPDGGLGGRGGDIIFQGESGLTTLLDFRYNRIIKAENGVNGAKKDCFGADGDDVIVKVPLGTVVKDLATGKVKADITKPGEKVIIAKGGRGGRGNAFFVTKRNIAPDFCEKGFPGEEFDLQLELKVLADVGLVGFPSVGKSTLISVVSECKPKIAAYHFTTLHPNLGVVSVGDGRSFVMADLPGLIEGASTGLGLGFEFLRHIERTKVIVHVIDMGEENPYDNYLKIRKELETYDEGLLKRPEIIVLNKIDLLEDDSKIKEFKKHFKKDKDKKIISISAYTKTNLQELLYAIADTIDQNKDLKINEVVVDDEVVEYNYKEKGPLFEINKADDGVYVVTGNYIKKLFERCDFTHDTSVRLFAKKLRDIGVDDKLRELGVQNGDSVRIFEYEFEFID